LLIVLGSCSYKELGTAKTILIIFFVASCVLAIFESVFKHYTFPLTSGGFGIAGFRSTSFNNHPLNNSLITSVIMGFILISKIRDSYKLMLYALGLISILSFGARSSFGIMLIFFLIYMYKYRKVNRCEKKFVYKKSLLSIYILVIIGFIGLTSVMVSTDIANRIINNLTIDSSVMARINVLDLLRHISVNQMFKGVNQEAIELFMRLSNIHQHIENFWILWIFWFGVIFSVALTIYFVFFSFNQLHRYSHFSKRFVFAIFFIIASTNNSLAYNTTVISVFVLCAFVLEDGFIPDKNLTDRIRVNKYQRL
jgi:hypothetical protein